MSKMRRKSLDYVVLMSGENTQTRLDADINWDEETPGQSGME